MVQSKDRKSIVLERSIAFRASGRFPSGLFYFFGDFFADFGKVLWLVFHGRGFRFPGMSKAGDRASWLELIPFSRYRYNDAFSGASEKRLCSSSRPYTARAVLVRWAIVALTPFPAGQ